VKILPRIIVCSLFLVVFAAFQLNFYLQKSARAQETEETYSISLTKTAQSEGESGEERRILEVDGRRVLTETHAIKKGEWIWQVLREKELLKKRNLVELLEILKKLNPELESLDKVHPGQKIVVPLTLAPAGGVPPAVLAPEPVTVTPEVMKDMDLERYTVHLGDSLIKIVNRKYDSPDGTFCEEYLEAVRKLNPSIKNLNLIYPGQRLRLPVFSPEKVRVAIEKTDEPPSPVEEEMPEMLIEPPPETVQISSVKEIPNPLRDKLGQIFHLLGEDWIQRGQHFIPLKGQGEINLRADAYPMIDLSNGLKVIVDLEQALPGRMATLIESTWENYRIVHLGKNDDLKSALNNILPECNLGTVLGRGEAVHLEGDIPIKLTGDWILRKTDGANSNGNIVVITILDSRTPPTPPIIRDYLLRRGVKIIDYPPNTGADPLFPAAPDVLNPGSTVRALLEAFLDLHGLEYLRNVEIPVYKEEGTDYNLFVKADYLLERDGVKYMLDLTGVGSDLIALMREHDLSYLHLEADTDPLAIVTQLLEFLNIAFDPGPLDLMATERDGYQNIRVRIQGVAFDDKTGRHLLATRLRLPDEILRLLAVKGYQVLQLSSL
jgi:hypothetical protein